MARKCKWWSISNWSIVYVSLQYVTEKMGGAEGTKLDLDFMEMERVSNYEVLQWRPFY